MFNRKTMLLVLLILGMLLFFPVIAKADEVQYKVTADFLTIRTDAGAKYTAVGKIMNGKTFTVTEYKKAKDGGTWGKTTYGKVTGWVNVGYAKVVSSTKTASKTSSEKVLTKVKVYEVTASSLNVRSGVGVKYKLICRLVNGSQFTVSKTKKASDGGTWGYLPDEKGWANIGYAKLIDNDSNEYVDDDDQDVTGWVADSGKWKYYSNGELKFTSNAFHAANVKIDGKTSKTSYYIVVDKANFRVFIFKKSGSSWVPVTEMKCSIGKDSTPTPSGSFELLSRWYILTSSGSWEYYPVEFSNDGGVYCFHSILYEKGTPFEECEKAKVLNGTLGKAISHGCIRLSLSNARWLWTNCKNGTKVLIY